MQGDTQVVGFCFGFQYYCLPLTFEENVHTAKSLSASINISYTIAKRELSEYREFTWADCTAFSSPYTSYSAYLEKNTDFDLFAE